MYSQSVVQVVVNESIMFSFLSNSHLFWDIFLNHLFFLFWANAILNDYNEFL